MTYSPEFQYGDIVRYINPLRAPRHFDKLYEILDFDFGNSRHVRVMPLELLAAGMHIDIYDTYIFAMVDIRKVE